MNVTELQKRAEEFLFGRGQQVNDYFIEITPVSEMLCYRNAQGREFDLPINDADLAAAVFNRLKELDVVILRI